MLILASASPRRRELLGLTGYDFEVQVSEADESVESGLPVEEVVMTLARRKAEAVFCNRLASHLDDGNASNARNGSSASNGNNVSHACNGSNAINSNNVSEGSNTSNGGNVRNNCGAYHCDNGSSSLGGGDIVLGSDTIVVLDGQIMGKPKDAEDAARMLRGLSGRTHHVYTGVALLSAKRQDVFYSVTEVEFYPLTEEEIQNYIATGEPMDKAGAYGIQGRGAVLVKGIRGDYFTVVGLPVAETARHLKAMRLFNE